jgi:hypothetical protein
MLKRMIGTRWATGAFAAAALVAFGCSKFKDDLLSPQNFGLIDPSAVGSPDAAAALRVGAIGQLKNMVNSGGGETLWPEVGHMTDEFRNSDFQIERADVDRRTMTTSSTYANYSGVTRARGFIRDAIKAMTTYLPQNKSDIGELYMALGFVEMSLAENFCNGIPLGATVAGQQSLGPPLTNQQVLDSAGAHLDSALAVNTGSAAGDLFIKQASLIVRARIMVDKGQFAAAAALVPPSAVPSTMQYVFTTSTALNSDDLGLWSLANNIARITVSDSFDILPGGAVNIVKNQLPFASVNDPRVPVLSGAAVVPKITAEDGTTPMFLNQIWKGRDDPMPMVSGIDARLIEAEAKLNAADYAGMIAILNQLRVDRPTIGNYKPGAMSPIATVPATKDAAVTFYFRDKAFWTFARGQRLNDLRRLMRQYGRTEDQVYPTGVYNGWGGGNYGHDLQFPVDNSELANPNFHGCIDRLP